MAFNGSGVFVRLYNWVQDKTNGIPITSSRMDAELDGIAAGLSNCITRDGQGKTTVDLTPASDNTLNLGTNVLRWASINGNPINAITMSSGTFTCSLTGCTTVPTGTAQYVIVGKIVMVQLPGLTAVSNSNSCSIGGVPLAIQSSLSQLMPIAGIRDNGGALAVGGLQVGNSPTFYTLYNSPMNVTGWTTSGVKGLGAPIAFSYMLP